MPCPRIAEGLPKPSLRTAVVPAKEEFAWGVQLIGSGSEAAAHTAYREMQKKYALLLAAHPPLVLRTSLGLRPGTGSGSAPLLVRALKPCAQSCAPPGEAVSFSATEGSTSGRAGTQTRRASSAARRVAYQPGRAPTRQSCCRDRSGSEPEASVQRAGTAPNAVPKWRWSRAAPVLRGFAIGLVLLVHRWLHMHCSSQTLHWALQPKWCRPRRSRF